MAAPADELTSVNPDAWERSGTSGEFGYSPLFSGAIALLGRLVVKGLGPSRPLILAISIAISVGCDVRGPSTAGLAVDEHPGYLASPLDRGALRAGYLERLRLGMGSPFRLVEFALSDPRLEPEDRRDIGQELLERTARGDLYEIDPSVLMPSGLPPAARVAQAAAHLELIELVVVHAADPRAGELTVRLAYRLATLERSVQAQLLPMAVSVAALIRDREHAIDDARKLLDRARTEGVDPVELVPLWRATRQFQVEQPVANPIEERLQTQAIRSIPVVLESIRRVGFGQAPLGRRRASISEDADALERLGTIADSMNMPPRAPIALALRVVGGALPASLQAREREVWEDFATGAWNEEKFVSRQANLLSREPALRTAIAASRLFAAVGLRTDAQERAWFPGMPTLTPQQFQARHGIALRAGDHVESRWVPYFTESLDKAVDDLKRIFPQLGLYGLTIEIPLQSVYPRTLASYDARTRTIQWPASTGPGTLAHEIAHDLDYGAVRKTNSQARSSASDAPSTSLAAALAILTRDGPVATSFPAGQLDHTQRPGEVIARTFDWFVITRLGAMGRVNGTLSSAQDEVFTGNGSLGPPGVRPEYGPAVIEAVRSLVPIPEGHRIAFLAEFGRLQWPGPNALLSAVSARLEEVAHDLRESSAMEVPIRSFTAIADVGEEVLRQLDRVRCEGRLPLTDRHLYSEHRQLVSHAVAASARGVALDAATDLGGPDAAAWMIERFYGWPRNPIAEPNDTSASVEGEPLHIVPTLQAIATEALAVETIALPITRSGFIFASPRTRCEPAAPLLDLVR